MGSKAGFNVVVDGDIATHIVATHLQPYNDEIDEKIRCEQLLSIVDHFYDYRKEVQEIYPSILVGDLNITWGTKEYRNSLLLDGFVDNYTKSIEYVELANATATDYIMDCYKNRVEEELLLKENRQPFPIERNRYVEIIDYSLLLANDAALYDIQTWRVPAFDISDVGNALSDHHALVSRISMH